MHMRVEIDAENKHQVHQWWIMNACTAVRYRENMNAIRLRIIKAVEVYPGTRYPNKIMNA